MSEKAKRYRIGYALAPKKVQSFITPSLIETASEKGIDLVEIHLNKPLIDQGPFDCIIHKLSIPEWTCQLLEYHSQNPNVSVIDSPDAIECLHNRVSMLNAVLGLKICHKISLSIPKQVVLESPESAFDCIRSEGMDFPLIAKPHVADGSSTSHQMFIILGESGLKGLESNNSYVLQEFINHGGVIYKVYVAGEHVKCVKRRSLPDIMIDKVEMPESFLSISRISSSPVPTETDESVNMVMEEAEMPPSSFVNEVANGLRKALRLNLFNFDMLKDGRIADRYLVIDINYFPGYAKIPCFENFLTNFFLDIVKV